MLTFTLKNKNKTGTKAWMLKEGFLSNGALKISLDTILRVYHIGTLGIISLYCALIFHKSLDLG
jgi:hypothetical protein